MYKLYFSCLPFAFALVSFLLFVLPLRLRVRAQAIWCMVLLLCAIKFVVFHFVGGDAFAPELPEKVMWVLNWACAGLYFLAPLSAVGLFIPRKIRLVFIPLLAWLIAGKGMYNALALPKLVETEFFSENISEELDGYKIVQLSDLHISSAARRWRTEAIVEKVNSLHPDLIVLTGDLSDGFSRHRLRDIEPLRHLRAKDGVFSCTGNHEYYFDWDTLRSYYDAWGLRFLDTNDRCAVREDFLIAGVRDAAHYHAGLPRVKVDDQKIFGGVTNGVFCLLLQHQPSLRPLIGTSSDARVDLQLSGHTHGGVAPGIDILARRANDGYLKGAKERMGGGLVYTSAGAGQWAGFPMRFFNPPEMTLLTLRHR